MQVFPQRQNFMFGFMCFTDHCLMSELTYFHCVWFIVRLFCWIEGISVIEIKRVPDGSVGKCKADGVEWAI